MPASLVIAAKDIRQRFRDRSAIVLGFVAPVLIALLMSLAFRGTAHFHVTIVLVDRDHGPIAAQLDAALRSRDLHDLVTVHTARDVATASARVHAGDDDVGLVVPAGFSAAVTSNRAAEVQVLTSVDRQLAAQVAQSITHSFTAQVDADRLSVATAVAAGAPASHVQQLVQDAAQLHNPLAATVRPIGSKPLAPISYYAPAMAIFFVLFAVGFASRSFFTERTTGMIDRVTAAPVGLGSVLLGKSLSVLAYGVASLATMFVITTLFFGADWGPPLPAAGLCIAMTLSVVALTAFVISIARTQRQAEGLASIIVFGLAILGGNFVTIATAPAVMRRLALLTPNGWALRGLTDLGTGARGAVYFWEPFLAILAFTAVVGVAAALLEHRIVER